MAKITKKQGKRDIKRAAIVELTAGITHKSKRSVQRVLVADQENKQVLDTYMFLDEGVNELLKQVKILVPFK